MNASARLDGQDNQQEGHIDLDLLCPDCSYCLRGLPFERRCPECGFSYVAEYPSEAQAAKLFRQQIRAVVQCGISPQLAVRYPIVPFAAVLLVACACSVLLIAGLCLTNKLGFMLATPEYPPRCNIVAAFGIYGARGGLLRWNVYGMEYLARWSLYVQLLVSVAVWCMYAARSGSFGAHGRTVRRLGLLAACSSAPAVLVPGLVVSLWQIPSILAPMSRYAHGLGISELFRHPLRSLGDPLQVVGVVLLVLATIWSAKWILLRHSACAIKLREIIRGVRAADNAGETIN